jgi:ubiquinone/menaquinone biosynthesis C-methylase UbiE
MQSAADLARAHWNQTPLFFSEEERYAIYPWLYEAAEFTRHKGDRVLEVGCGTGCDLLQFAKHGAQATGVDFTPAHLELARQRVGNAAKVVEGDATALPFADASFDYVYSHGVIHHCSEPRKASQEILRVLRPGGRFNVQLYAKWSFWHFQRRLQYTLRGKDWKRYVENSEAPVHIDLYTKRSMSALFSPVPLVIRKYEFRQCQLLGRWLGWYIVATGKKPL